MDKQTLDSVGAETAVATNSNSLPDWLTAPAPRPPATSSQGRALLFDLYEAVFPRVLDKIYSGSTLQAALKDDFRDIDAGAFMRWIKKDPDRHGLYKEAKEIRTEAWAGRLIDHAVGADLAEDVQRSKVAVDAYKWLMAADNRRVYGETKQIDFGGTISINSVLAAARERIVNVIDITPQLEMDD
jgi:hypothetical protein